MPEASEGPGWRGGAGPDRREVAQRPGGVEGVAGFEGPSKPGLGPRDGRPMRSGRWGRGRRRDPPGCLSLAIPTLATRGSLLKSSMARPCLKVELGSGASTEEGPTAGLLPAREPHPSLPCNLPQVHKRKQSTSSCHYGELVKSLAVEQWFHQEAFMSSSPQIRKGTSLTSWHSSHTSDRLGQISGEVNLKERSCSGPHQWSFRATPQWLLPRKQVFPVPSNLELP